MKNKRPAVSTMMSAWPALGSNQGSFRSKVNPWSARTWKVWHTFQDDVVFVLRLVRLVSGCVNILTHQMTSFALTVHVSVAPNIRFAMQSGLQIRCFLPRGSFLFHATTILQKTTDFSGFNLGLLCGFIVFYDDCNDVFCECLSPF